MDQDSAHMVAASKVPMLKPGEYEIWRMRIEQYIQMIDYALWEVIENGATLPKTTTVEGVVTVSNEHENVDGVHEQIAGDILDKLQTGSVFSTTYAQVDHAQDVDEEVVEGEENVAEEEEEGFVEDDKDIDFDWDVNKLPPLRT
ncbi:hypothetical protein Tco_1207781 [Tanacetum coccineum]